QANPIQTHLPAFDQRYLQEDPAPLHAQYRDSTEEHTAGHEKQVLPRSSCSLPPLACTARPDTKTRAENTPTAHRRRNPAEKSSLPLFPAHLSSLQCWHRLSNEDLVGDEF
ncbi:Hypothetical predicted protein, partial [Pelobates cultripes]